MGLFDSVFGGGTDTSALTSYGAKTDKRLHKGEKKGVGELAKGLKQASPSYDQAAEGFSPYMQSGSQLNSMYTDALGGNGQEGFDRATGAFHQAPGYQFLVDQGEQGVMRNNAAMGGVASGNTLTDLTKFRVGLADQTWQQNLDNLFRGSGQGLQAAQGASGALTAKGAMTAGNFADRAGIRTGAAGARASNTANIGLGLQNQTAADQASQLSLLNSIIGAGAKLAGGGTV
jgi:hypothetical protein